MGGTYHGVMSAYAFLVDLASFEPGITEDDVKPGYVALGIVVILCIATYFLCRSFLAHSRRAQLPWEGEEADPGISRTTPHDRSS